MSYSAFDRLRPVLAWSAALIGIALIALFAGSSSPRTHSADRKETDSPGIVALTIRADYPLGPIDAAVYGMAQPPPAYFADLRLKLWRWGGNPATRYNWEKGNCWNATADWGFRNGNYNSTSREARMPSGVADAVIATGKLAGSEALITIPTLGWVARDDNNATASTGVPPVGGPPIAPGSEAIAGYDPADNRRRVSQRSLPRKGAPFSDPPNLADDIVYQDEWVYHLTRKFGRAEAGGVRFYAMDNEPDLWSATHRDMHPVQPDYDELFKQFTAYADAVKDVDPSARVTGPVSWGWTGYLYSPRDQGSDNYRTAADRRAHGGLPFLAWFLRQVSEHDRQRGRRTLDVLDVHYYPQEQGVYSGATDDATNRLRLRSTRALWDTNYADESWISTEVALIPRLRKWIDQYYPGTKLGITEWNWGADTSMNGGLAIAEVLGVLGRERVDLACYWTAPGTGTPGYYAWKMYRNADGAGNGFGDIAVAVAGDPGSTASCYASIESQSGNPVLMLLNKSPGTAQKFQLNIQSGRRISTASAYRYGGTDLRSIVHLPNISITNGEATLEAPPYSITLLRCR